MLFNWLLSRDSLHSEGKLTRFNGLMFFILFPCRLRYLRPGKKHFSNGSMFSIWLSPRSISRSSENDTSARASMRSILLLYKFRISRFLKFRPTSPRMFLILLFSKASVTRSGKLTPFSPSAVSSRLTDRSKSRSYGKLTPLNASTLTMELFRRTSSFNFGKVNPKSGSTDLMSF